MKPKVQHKEAMDFSFKAKEAFEKGDDTRAIEYYTRAAELESEVAEFYFDKPELEPTRSLLIRSAAFLNLKAGLVEKSQRFIFFGLLNLKDELSANQLKDALEFSLTLKNIDEQSASYNFEYLKVLRLRSVHYVLEPASPKFGTAVTLEMIRDFSENYIRSLKAYSIAAFHRIANNVKNIAKDIESASKQFEELVNPLVTSSGFGSFKFSIANDFLARNGESSEIVKLKATVINRYHDEIFTLQLTDDNISFLRDKYQEEEINQIFRPLVKIKANNVPYRVGYFDRDSLNKVYVENIVNAQKRKLLPVHQISEDDIGILENSIVHTRSSEGRGKLRSVIYKEQFKSYEFDLKISQIEPNDRSPIILNEEIFVSVNFSSEKGFTFYFDDLHIENVNINYQLGLTGFHNIFIEKIIYLKNKKERNEVESKEWNLVKRLINNPEAVH